MHYLIAALLLICMFPRVSLSTCGGTTTVSGDKYTAYDATYDCVNLAIIDAYTAGYGKTVEIPEGTATWPNLGKLIITKSVIINGAGIGKTVITNSDGDGTTSSGNAMVSIYPDNYSAINDLPFEITGIEFHISNNTTYDIINFSNSDPNPPIRNLKIHNNKFVGYGYGIGIIQGYNSFGVVYDNIFLNLSHAWRLIAATTLGWTNGDEWIPGSANAMYYEDNELIHDTGCILVSGGRGLRMVARYNKLNSATNCYPNFDIHGIQVAAGIGYELYGNLVNTISANFLDQRGGQVFMFGNNFPNDTDGLTYSQRTEWQSDYNGGLDANVNTTYKVTAQGNYDQNVHWSYYWSNYYGAGGADHAVLPNSLTSVEDTYYRDGPINDPLTIVENQSHWVNRPSQTFTGAVAPIGSCGEYGKPDCTASGVGCGQLSSRPESCTIGVGYWATDQSCTDLIGMAGPNPTTPISGTLYKCTATNQWEEYYRPYTYPHPLRISHYQRQSSGFISGGAIQ